MDRRRCPNCGSTEGFAMERCPDGNTSCTKCGHRSPHKDFCPEIHTCAHIDCQAQFTYPPFQLTVELPPPLGKTIIKLCKTCASKLNSALDQLSPRPVSVGYKQAGNKGD